MEDIYQAVEYEIYQVTEYDIYQVGKVAQRNCPGRWVVGDPSLQFLNVGSVPEIRSILKALDSRNVCRPVIL